MSQPSVRLPFVCPSSARKGDSHPKHTPCTVALPSTPLMHPLYTTQEPMCMQVPPSFNGRYGARATSWERPYASPAVMQRIFQPHFHLTRSRWDGSPMGLSLCLLWALSSLQAQHRDIIHCVWQPGGHPLLALPDNTAVTLLPAVAKAGMRDTCLLMWLK